MGEDWAMLYGEIDWPRPKERMAEILRDARLQVHLGRFSVRVEECSHFVFQEYGGDLGDPCIDADAETAEEMIADASRVSAALAAADVKHRFEVHIGDDDEAVWSVEYPKS